MKIKEEANGKMSFSGYANVPGRKSRTLYDSTGQAYVEIIEQGAFANAIKKAPRIEMLIDHDRTKVVASTFDGTLTVKEDAVGLKIEGTSDNKELLRAAKDAKIRGWSFNMKNAKSTTDPPKSEGDLPIRHINGFDMEEVSICISTRPCYSSTSFETRSEGEDELIETRSATGEIEFEGIKEPNEPEKTNLEELKERLNKI